MACRDGVAACGVAIRHDADARTAALDLRHGVLHGVGSVWHQFQGGVIAPHSVAREPAVRRPGRAGRRGVAGDRPGGATGSIVFTKAGDVYRARPDGSHARRLTRSGRSRPYRHPTQADDGTVVAVRADTTFYRFSRRGRRVGRARRIATGLHNGGSLHTLALSPAVSPNGREIAVSDVLLQGIYDPSTGARGMNLVAITIQYHRAATGRRVGQIHVPGDYLESPSWVNNMRVLFFAPLVGYAAQVDVDTRHGRAQPWFADELGGEPSFDRKPLDEGELTRAATSSR